MNGLRDEPFPGAVFTGDQHVRVGGRRPLDELDDGPHRRRSRNQRNRAVEVEPSGSLELPSALQRAAQLHLRSHDRQQPCVIPGLLNEVAGASPHRLNRDVDARPCGQHDDGQRRVLGCSRASRSRPSCPDVVSRA